jgi:hypothetical protein
MSLSVLRAAHSSRRGALILESGLFNLMNSSINLLWQLEYENYQAAVQCRCSGFNLGQGDSCLHIGISGSSGFGVNYLDIICQ